MYTGNRPAAQQIFTEATVAAPLLAGTEGQLIGVIEDQPLRRVETFHRLIELPVVLGSGVAAERARSPVSVPKVLGDGPVGQE